MSTDPTCSKPTPIRPDSSPSNTPSHSSRGISSKLAGDIQELFFILGCLDTLIMPSSADETRVLTNENLCGLSLLFRLLGDKIAGIEEEI